MGKIVIHQTDEKQTIILTNDSEGVSGGYYDPEGVWHNFGGGGTETHPLLHVNIVNGSEGINLIRIPSCGLFLNSDGNVSLDNDHSQVINPLEPGNSIDLTYLAGGFRDAAEDPFYFGVRLGQEYFSFSNETHGRYITSDSVNCDFDDESFVEITDPTKDASITLTVYEAI